MITGVKKSSAGLPKSEPKRDDRGLRTQLWKGGFVMGFTGSAPPSRPPVKTPLSKRPLPSSLASKPRWRPAVVNERMHLSSALSTHDSNMCTNRTTETRAPVTYITTIPRQEKQTQRREWKHIDSWPNTPLPRRHRRTWWFSASWRWWRRQWLWLGSSCHGARVCGCHGWGTTA